MVLAIIAVLAAMLLPALKGAKDAAKSAGCMNNLRQMSLAFHLYRDDNRDWVPPITIYDTNDTTTCYIANLPHRLNVYMTISTNVWRTHVLKNPWVCPANPTTDAYQGSQQFWIGCGWTLRSYYGANRYLGLSPFVAQVPGSDFRMRRYFRNPTATVLYFDAWDPDVSSVTLMKARHGGRINMLFADGHTEGWTPNKVPASYLNPFWNPE